MLTENFEALLILSKKIREPFRLLELNVSRYLKNHDELMIIIISRFSFHLSRHEI